MRRKWPWPAGVILLAVITHYRWFTGFSDLVSGDWQFRPPGAPSTVLSLPSAWSPDIFGGVNLNAPFYILNSANALLMSSGLAFGQVERILFLWPAAVLTPLGMFLLVRKLTKSDPAAFVASVAYAYNVYFLLIQTQHLYIMLADAVAPFAVLSYLRFMETRTWRGAVRAGLWLALASVFDARICYLLCGVLVGWSAFDAAVRHRWREWSPALREFAFGLVPQIVVVILGLYWILAIGSAGSLTSNVLLDRPLFGDYLSDLGTSFTMFSGSWTGALPEAFGTRPVPAAFWILPFAAFGGLYVKRRDPRVAFFGLVSIIGIFLSKQSAPPFGAAYTWMFAHVPGFNAFREATKLKVLVALGFCPLVGYLVAWFLSAEGSSRRRAAGRVSVAVILAASLWNAKPLITGEIGRLYVPVTHDAAYDRLNALLQADNEFGRVFWIPVRPTWATWSSTHPPVPATVFSLADRRPGLFGCDAAPTPCQPADNEAAFERFFASASSEALLDEMGVRYVVVPPDDKDFMWSTYAGTFRRQRVLDIMGSVAYLKRLDVGLGDIVVYENPGGKPRVHVDAPVSAASVVADAGRATGVQDGPGRFRVTATVPDRPFTLHFIDSYRPFWDIDRVRGWFSLLLAPASPTGIVHAQDRSGFNAFQIDPAAACGWLDCTTAADGTRTMTFILYYRPQAYMYLGAVISLLALVGMLLFLACSRKDDVI